MNKAQTKWDSVVIDLGNRGFTLNELKKAIQVWGAKTPPNADDVCFEFISEEDYGYATPKLRISYVRDMTPLEIGRIRKKEDKIKELEIAELERIKAKYGLYN